MTMTTTLRRLLRHPGWRTPAAALSAALALSLGLLAGCGGGGGGNASTPSSPTAAVTVGISATPTSTTVGQPITLTWTTTNASAGSCAASGAWSGALATSGSQVVTAGSAGSAAYTITCSGVASTASVTIGAAPVLASGANTAPIVLDSGPDGTGNALNEPFVSVTVCRPGTTVCQTIDHVLLDTGSTGLRLIGPLSSLGLPAVTAPSGAPAAECTKFADGYTWGSVQQADVQIGGEKAASVALQVIGDTASNFAHVPASCTNAGGNIGTVAKLGAKGVLGLGLFKQDCGNGCVDDGSAGYYYACSASGSCSATNMPLAQQVSNPVASFASDNNGVLLVLPSVPTAGAATLTGTLVFGVNTQGNNTIAGETIYRTNNQGNFSTSYKGKILSDSFIDSGSNGLFFDDSTIANCSQSSGFYCPATTLSLSAVNTAADGSASGTVNFIIVNEQNLDDSIVAASIGGTAGSALPNSFDWGLPFFFGRRVFVVIEGASVGGSVGPYWAY